MSVFRKPSSSDHPLLPLIEFKVRLKRVANKPWSKPWTKVRYGRPSSQFILRHLQQFERATPGCCLSGGRHQDHQCLSLSHICQDIRWPLLRFQVLPPSLQISLFHFRNYNFVFPPSHALFVSSLFISKCQVFKSTCTKQPQLSLTLIGRLLDRLPPRGCINQVRLGLGKRKVHHCNNV